MELWQEIEQMALELKKKNEPTVRELTLSEMIGRPVKITE